MSNEKVRQPDTRAFPRRVPRPLPRARASVRACKTNRRPTTPLETRPRSRRRGAQVAELKKMFDDTAAARAARQKAKPLVERLGGRDAIHAVVNDIVHLHFTEPLTAPLCKGVDQAKLVGHVVDWLCQAAGGRRRTAAATWSARTRTCT